MRKTFFKPKSTSAPLYSQALPDNQEDAAISGLLSVNLNTLRSLFSNCSDITFSEFFINSINRSATLIYINELVDIKLINESVMRPLTSIKQFPQGNLLTGFNMELIKKYFLDVADIDELYSVMEIVNALLNGDSVFLLDGETCALKMKTQGWKERAIPEARIEQIIRGPKEGFTESISTNTSLIRRRIKSSQLKVEQRIVGRLTQTKVNIIYIDGIVDENVVKEVKERIDKIDTDSILESGYIEEFIEDTPYTVFPQIQHTEKPDKAAASILEGRVALLIDGTPFVLILPAIMIQFFQSPDDYYERYPAAIAIRTIRYIFAMVALLLPGCYVAIVLYHREMIPTPLFISIIQAGAGVPFPLFFEALIMEISFEAIREAGTRLPGPANQTVGIVGVLIIGDAAVRAGIVSPIMVIIISITAVASFSIPAYDMGYSVRIMRFGLLVLGAFLGLYGILLGILVLLIHLTSLKSFGVPYVSPLAPLRISDLKDVILRFPWWAMKKRPSFANPDNQYRQNAYIKPAKAADPKNNEKE